ncbi:MAG: Folate synthesis bifunctional protein [uncultured bacterium]|nr:MAG: Folate synthesis bifunctional protein [uncultured bacterium]
MVILGLGSNVGDKLANLRFALHLIKKIPAFSVAHVSPVYLSDALLPDNAPVTWDTPYLNLALLCETTLTPYALLHHVKEIEKKIGRTPEKVWGPRIIDIDILAWDALIQHDEKLHIPHEHLDERPFALWPLADVAPFWMDPLNNKTAAEMVAKWGSRFNGKAPFHTQQIAQRIDTPQLMGIINATPDSFSDGGKYTNDRLAADYAHQLVLAGAEIIDIGAEATNPKATAISPEEEWRRLEPVLTAIMTQSTKMFIKPKISIDTRHPDVAKKALVLGADWINDVSGLENAAMRDVVANNACDIVVMHHLGIPVNKALTLPLNQNPIDLVLRWGEARLAEITQQGIAQERLIFDVGIGFGKTAEQSLALLRHIDQFHQLGVRLLVGHSRKRFLNLFTDKPFAERDIETTVLSLQLAQQQIHYLRVHNIEMHARAFKIAGS